MAAKKTADYGQGGGALAGGGASGDSAEDDPNQLIILPLGAGQEVGRSCIVLEFKGKKIMLDCGIHPGLSGRAALPYTDLVDAEEIDLLLVSHFHLDHCGALPWFLEKTTFRGRVFMTHATKAIYRWLLADYIKVSNLSADHMLYTEADLEKSMDKIETINFHQEKEVNGIRFWCYHAGHVLGAAMFMIEIAGVKVLYTGDFSRQEDRHLMAAEIPNAKPDVLICESTYGTHIHEEREVREARFTGLIHDIINRGGRCLIPVFALGRAQELLLILDEYWAAHPDLHEVPVYYASSLAKRCMAVYQTFINAMNDRIRHQINVSNPFIFKHISNLRHMDQFEDLGPCVVLASPGMMQSGLSRELFESWCMDARNGVIIAGYCVEGTLAKQILSEPEEIVAQNGQKLPLKCSVHYISFSAHTDYRQTSEFIRALLPPHVVLVHGEANEMGRLKDALIREYEDDPDHRIQVWNPRNSQALELYFRGDKYAKVMGSLATSLPQHDSLLTGVLVKKNWHYHLVDPDDLNNYTEMSPAQVTQRVSVAYSGSLAMLQHSLLQVAKDADRSSAGAGQGRSTWHCFNQKVTLTFNEADKMCVVEWAASPKADLYADAIMAAVAKAERSPLPSHLLPPPFKVDSGHFAECLMEYLGDMCGPQCVEPVVKKGKLMMSIRGVSVTIDLQSMEVSCAEDHQLQKILSHQVKALSLVILPLTK